MIAIEPYKIYGTVSFIQGCKIEWANEICSGKSIATQPTKSMFCEKKSAATKNKSLGGVCELSATDIKQVFYVVLIGTR
jgi:hypothetical protein